MLRLYYRKAIRLPKRFSLNNSQRVIRLFSSEYEGFLVVPAELDPEFHARYKPKVVSSGTVRTETARYLRDLGINFGQIENRSPLHRISLFTNYDLEHTKNVVEFWKSAGLTDSQVCHIIMKRPHILLRPRKFFRERMQEIREELDLTKKQALDLVAKQPNLLNDAEKLVDIVAKRHQMKRLLEITNDNFMEMVIRDPRFLFHSWEHSNLVIIDFLKSLPFGTENLKKILIMAPSVIGSKNTNKIESQVELFLGYMGFTEQAFADSVPEYPHLLVYRQRLLKLKYNIIKNTGIFDWQDIARAPLTLGYSVERIYMRLNFLKYLNRMEKDRFRLSSILILMDDKYLKHIANSDAETYKQFQEKEIDNVRKMRNKIRTRVIHSELELLSEEGETQSN